MPVGLGSSWVGTLRLHILGLGPEEALRFLIRFVDLALALQSKRAEKRGWEGNMCAEREVWLSGGSLCRGGSAARFSSRCYRCSWLCAACRGAASLCHWFPQKPSPGITTRAWKRGQQPTSFVSVKGVELLG